MKQFFKYSGIALAYLFAFIGVQYIINSLFIIAILVQIASTSGPDFFSSPDAVEKLSQIVLRHGAAITLVSNFLTVAGLFLFFKLRKKSLCQEIKLTKTSPVNLVLAPVIGASMSYTLDFVLSLLPVSPEVMENFAQQHDALMSGNPLICFLAVVLLAPISEEFIFRGLIYGNLKKGTKILLAGLLSALMFGFVHGHPIWMLVGFLAGLCLVYVYEVTGSLWCCILVHLTNNCLAYLSPYLPEFTGTSLYIVSGSSVFILILSGLSLLLLRKHSSQS